MFPCPVLFVYWWCYVCLLPALCSPLVCLLKTVIPANPTSPCSLPPRSSTVTEYQTTKEFNCVFSLRLISIFWYSVFFCFPMDPLATLFTSFARKDLPLWSMWLSSASSLFLTAFDDAALSSLFWIGTNYHCPCQPPRHTGLSWREAIIRCLESVYPRSRAQPDPEPSPPLTSLHGAKAWAHRWRRAQANDKPLLYGATTLRITVEPELLVTSDQVREAGYNARHEEKGCG